MWLPLSFIPLAAVALSAAAAVQSSRQNEVSTPPRAIASCASLTAPEISNATVVSFESIEERGVISLAPTSAAGPGTQINTLDFCNVTLILTHGDAGDRVTIQTWLPLENWNGRFQGTGGIGFVAGMYEETMMAAVEAGFAAASTNAGLPVTITESTFFNNDGSSLNQLFTNFAYLSVHEMALVGKAVVEEFYGEPPKFSYMSGCSTGGRQGMMAAQKFPDDFDGILAAAPAINWGTFLMAGLWPYVVMNVEGETLTECIWNYFRNETIMACDGEDNATDGVISNPGRCNFDAMSLTGRSFICNGTSGTISQRQATIYSKVLEGPRTADGKFIWYGLIPGTSGVSLSSSDLPALSVEWLKVVQHSSSFDIKTMNYDNFPELITRAQDTFGSAFDASIPDLSSFKSSGGKILTWHGLADPLIPPNGTFAYRDEVVRSMGGSAATTDDFYRVFSAPGIVHCGGGAGAEPVSAIDTLVAWVEEGNAPDTLAASKGNMTRNLCRYPYAMEYSGTGDVKAASSWVCRETEGSPAQNGGGGDTSDDSESGTAMLLGRGMKGIVEVALIGWVTLLLLY